jgi:mRNA-degrading endonuclease RelE of RelBE toxin-antitoxin system
MAKVVFEANAAGQFRKLPERIKSRVIGLIERLERWPAVSGAKPLRANLAGHYRLRTGDYRVQFRVHENEVIIEHIGHRDRFYDE